MIQTPQIDEDSRTLGLMFRWQGMTIYLGGTLTEEDGKFMLLTVGNAGSASLGLIGNTARWTTYNQEGEKTGVSASTISNGSADPATSKSTGER